AGVMVPASTTHRRIRHGAVTRRPRAAAHTPLHRRACALRSIDERREPPSHRGCPAPGTRDRAPRGLATDALLLSRIQFAFVISFHVLFPAFTIGLAWWLSFVEWRWLRTHDAAWRRIYFFWMRIFAISFGMGVVSGIVMTFQFGANWPELSRVG